MKRFAILLTAMAVTMAPVIAQSSANKASLVGTVYDTSGAVVPNVAVKATNSNTGFEREGISNSLGQYRFVLLDPGNYTLTASAPDFAVNTIEGVVLNVGGSVAVDIILQVEEATTTVEVAASLIQAAEPAPMTPIVDEAITNLPINGRRFQDFATLTPTVQVEPQRSSLSFAGQRGVNSNVMLDGADYNNPFFGGIRGGERSNFIFTVPQSAVQEFQVVTTGYNAEYGRSTGGIMNVLTKSGTNDFHGSAFWQFRDGDLSAEDPIFNLQTGERQHQFGGSFGGPIVANKLFFFVAVERQDVDAPRLVSFSRLDTFTPTADTQEAFDFYRGQEEEFTLTNNGTALTARGDYQTDSGHRLTLRYNFSDATAENATNTGNALSSITNRAVSNDGIEKDRTHTGTAQYTHIFSPSVLNDLRFTGTYELRPRLNNADLPEVGNAIGIYGGRSFLPTTQDDTRLQVSDAISVTKGAHTVKLGIDYNYVDTAQTFGFSQFGRFGISGSNTDAILELMTIGGPTENRFDSSAVTYTRQIGNLLAAMTMHQLAFFAQDSWRVSPDLTLNFGLRWEGQYNPEPEATNTDLVNLVKGYTSTLGATLDPTQIPDATDQWMPRFGFAWTPLKGARRTVIRGHAGIFYASSPLLLLADASNNFRATPGNLSVFIGPTSNGTVYDHFKAVGVDLNQASLGALPVLSIEQALQAAAIARGEEPNPFIGANVGLMATDFRNPRSYQGGIGFDTEITRNFIAGAQFNYINTVHLQRNRDHNLPAPVIREDDASQRPFFGLRSGTPRPINTLGTFTVRESSARGMYRGLTFSGQYRANRLNFGAFYTWSENFTNDDNERNSSGLDAENQFNLIPDYNYSRIDARHQFTSYAVGDLPAGFQLSGSFTVRSGLPVNPTAGTDANQDLSSFSDRAYIAPGTPYLRNSFRDRSVVTANNLRVLKAFPIKERYRIELSAEFFNLFNLDNVVFASSFGDDAFGLGIDPSTGAVLPPRDDFMRLRLDDGSYDTRNRQIGGPFQAQFGARFFF